MKKSKYINSTDTVWFFVVVKETYESHHIVKRPPTMSYAPTHLTQKVAAVNYTNIFYWLKNRQSSLRNCSGCYYSVRCILTGILEDSRRIFQRILWQGWLNRLKNPQGSSFFYKGFQMSISVIRLRTRRTAYKREFYSQKNMYGKQKKTISQVIFLVDRCTIIV